MKKFNIIIFAAILCMAASCEKDPQGGALTINAQVVNGNDYNDLIDEVRAQIWYTIEADTTIYVFAKSNYNNGKFQMVLPKNVDRSAYTIEYRDYKQILPTIPCFFYAYKNNQIVGRFVYKSNTYSTSFNYCYRTDDVTLRDTPNCGGVNYKLKKGWTIIYSETECEFVIEQPNQEFNWYFIPNE